MKKQLMTGALLGVSLAASLSAAESIQAGSAFAFPSVQQGASARAIGLGSTYVGIAEGSTALLWNPAGLATLQDPEIAFHHMNGLVGATQEIAVLGLPLGYGNGLGMSLNYEDNGTFEGRDASGAVTGSYSAHAYGASLGWGFSANDGLSLGIALKANQQDIAGASTAGVAGDVGVLWSRSPELTLGAAYTNFGPDVNGVQLSQGLRLGLASYVNKCQDFQWLFALSGEALTHGDASLHIGLEHTLYQFLALRAGYAMNLPTPVADGLLGWSFGGGIIVNKLSVDYAYVPLADLGNMQRISVTYNFGERCGTTRTAEIVTGQAPVLGLAPPLSSTATTETALNFTDADFKRIVPNGEDELLTDAAEERLLQGLRQVSGVPGAFLTVTGETRLMLHPQGNTNGPELREIGHRRAAMVHAYLKKKMPDASINDSQTDGSDKVTPAPIFRVILR